MPRRQYKPKSEAKKVKEEGIEDYYVIVTRTERRDYHYRVSARTEEEAIEFAVDEYNPMTEKDIISLNEEFVNIIDWEARIAEKF
ncbi:hypothetical protein EU534_01640 [Candidatus Heimdallarchaeota archaeon]|nr:MAG: hypothetical protein EU534_01640 [Candidatus Heimdallarchaeota archaeon]